MIECKTCGTVLDGGGWHRGARRHKKRCAIASPRERAYYKRLGVWPRPGTSLKPLPQEVPEPPPTTGGFRR